MPEHSDAPGEPILDQPVPTDLSADLHTTVTTVDAPAETDDLTADASIVDEATPFAPPVEGGFAPAPGVGEPFVPAPPLVFTAPAPLAPKGLAIAALVTGVVAFLIGWLPGLGVALGIAAVVLGIVALVRRQSKPLAITGLSLGAVALVVSAVMTIVAVGLVAASFGEAVAEVQESTAPVDEEGGSSEFEEVAIDDYTTLDDASFAALVADPVAAFGEPHIIYGEVQQLDEQTGPCAALVAVDDAPQATWEGYAVMAWAFGSGETECPELDGIGELSHVKLWVTVLGSTTTEFDDGTVEDVLTLSVTKFEELAPLP